MSADDARCSVLARLTAPTGGEFRILVVAAHPDDEAIGAAAVIARRSRACWVVQVTDGAPIDRRYYPRAALALSRDAYAAERRREALRALGLAGLEPTRLRSLGVADQQVASEAGRIARRLVEAIDELRPEVIVTHAYEGGHPDHDATALAVHAARAVSRRRGARTPPVVEMTGYHDENGGTVRGRFLPAGEGGSQEVCLELGSAERTFKRAMLAAYVTQREVLAPFGVETERFRLAPRYDFCAPPHAGVLSYERLGLGPSGAGWRAEVVGTALDLKRRSACPAP